ncbi:Csu type fimbrial protein [Lysobacter soyae]|uniref:Spore coat U domain-containing protein n=1 Tax=Lysobacter soyae TaxID=2764185 RepID=A0ABX8WM22_9GAMM|nr:spore coat U domain-containing protein [Lysobacter sp. CJ11]QYR52483.1 spore coat U domain-containing protein [Lysobacter sp. CJ11]
MILRTVLAIALASVVSAPAMADTKQASFDVKINVKKACSISVVAPDMNFASHDFNETGPFDATNDISVKCTKGTTYNVGLNAGTTTGGTEAARLMAGTGANVDKVAYGLYSNAGRTTNWGGTIATGAVGGTGNNNVQTLTVYGRVLSSALNVTPDDYKDTITATITY